jgi:hypothetical protein
MKQLTELRFGKITEEAGSNNNYFTTQGLRCVLRAFYRLNVLEMQLLGLN